MTHDDQTTGLTYAASGVDIEAQANLVERIKRLAQATPRSGVVSGVGGFAALYELPLATYPQPILVSGSDGVGTKLKLAHAMSRHDTIGIDLVAMCVNDVLCHRADPLYFLDYFATGMLNVDQAEEIIKGIATGCTQAGMALIGGETAELPGLYHGDDYDLAGFCVGMVDKSKMFTPQQVEVGDAVLAIASSGPHSNGYSLIRRIVELAPAGYDTDLGGQCLGDILLEPTKIYAKSLQALWSSIDLHGLAHITGGGLIENTPRILPEFTSAVLDLESWKWPEIFTWLQSHGNVADSEMFKTFNLGVGMLVVLAESDVEQAIDILQQQGEQVWRMGVIEKSAVQSPTVVLV
jgi:phosphoribosylformylglycinamidine cyclo-ligase